MKAGTPLAISTSRAYEASSIMGFWGGGSCRGPGAFWTRTEVIQMSENQFTINPATQIPAANTRGDAPQNSTYQNAQQQNSEPQKPKAPNALGPFLHKNQQRTHLPSSARWPQEDAAACAYLIAAGSADKATSATVDASCGPT